jgi:pyrroline-5-carboxylate reductase
MDLNRMHVGILGAGNIGGAIALGLVSSGLFPANQITLTRRRVEPLEEFKLRGFAVTTDNAEAIRNSDMIVLAVTPQQLNPLLADIRKSLEVRRHMIVSLVSGVTIAEIRRHLAMELTIVRAMPNTAIMLRQSMTCIAAEPGQEIALQLVKEIFDSLGKTLVIDEAHMIPATALCACGIAFFMRAVRAASQGGIEIGFHAEEALQMAAQTALGAASLLLQPGSHPEKEVDKVTTPEGCTISGLNQMEHNGFSSALIKGIVTSARKAEVLYKPKASASGT